MNRQAYEQEGRKAEARIVRYLRLRGYKILAERFKTPEGEVDIIAAKRKIIACVEVKQRATQRGADEAMDWRTEQRIMAAAEIWVERHFADLPRDFELRFDLAVIIGPASPLCPVQYLKHAFRAD
jgi:putative endonuclease